MLTQPSAIETYSKYMQVWTEQIKLRTRYDCSRKAYTWFKKPGLHFVQRSIMNAHYVFRYSTGNDISFLPFMQLSFQYLAEGETE